MKRIYLTIAVGVAMSASAAVIKTLPAIISESQIVSGEKYLLHNVGRNKWVTEDAYAALVMAGQPAFGTGDSNGYAFTITRTPEGLYTFATATGRYIPEVGNGPIASVGSPDRAGKFTITAADNGTFTIVNSQDTIYGFDASDANFVGWNAGKGTSCFYQLIPAEMGPAAYPLAAYDEPEDKSAPNLNKWLNQDSLRASWVSLNTDSSPKIYPAITLCGDTTITVWRGERAALKALVMAPAKVENLEPTASLPWVSPRWMRYVITDDMKACGDHKFSLPTWLSPQVIDLPGALTLNKQTTRPVWVSIDVPADIAAGTYDCTLTIGTAQLVAHIQVVDRQLPPPSEWSFWLDLWQQPYSVSRYHDVPRWSDAHFEAMRPYMEALGKAGQKVVSAILFHEPWGVQSHDKFDPMVETIRLKDGGWKFDYTIFDRWVNFMDQCGINKAINCYSMIPWDMSFRYIDEATDTYQTLKTKTTSNEYSSLWSAFLTDFAAHLREKGWFEKTTIAMDERGLGDMQNALQLLRSVVPDMKMSLAGNYHAELIDELHDYSLALGQEPKITNTTKSARRRAGKITTMYTCCADAYPGLFSNSQSAEAAFIPVHCVAAGFDGYLHWSWLNWHETPLTDTRFRLFSPGDTYFFYPGPRSSQLFERLVEGVQLAEKVRILKAEKSNLTALNAALKNFKDASNQDPEGALNELKAVVNIMTPTALPEVTDEGEPEASTLFDLQGRKVDSPSRGLYVASGRKIVK